MIRSKLRDYHLRPQSYPSNLRNDYTEVRPGKACLTTDLLCFSSITGPTRSLRADRTNTQTRLISGKRLRLLSVLICSCLPFSGYPRERRSIAVSSTAARSFISGAMDPVIHASRFFCCSIKTDGIEEICISSLDQGGFRDCLDN